MKKIDIRTLRRGLLAFFSFFPLAITCFAYQPPKTTNTFMKPDFAFPKTVEKNALPEYEKAMKTGNGEKALRAAIQLTVAESLVDGGSYPAATARFDSIAAVMKAPYASLALLLEANLYEEIYSSERWLFDSRILPPEPRPQDVMEWNRDMFGDKVASLVNASMREIDACNSIPLSDIKSLLSDAADAVKANFSVADFIMLRSLETLSQFTRSTSNMIPFGRKEVERKPADIPMSPDALYASILDMGISFHENDADKFILSLFCERKLDSFNSENKRREYLKHCLDIFGDTPYGGRFLLDYCNSELADDPLRKLGLLQDYIARFPQATFAGSIRIAIENITSREVSIRSAGQMLPNLSSQITVTGKNIYDFYILVFKIPEKERLGNQITYSSLAALGKPLHAVRVKASGEAPCAFYEKVEIPPLQPGEYAFVASESPTAAGLLEKNKKAWVTPVLVSDIKLLTLKPTDGKVGGTKKLYVVSGENQQPIEGASVTFWRMQSGRKVNVSTAITDSQGAVSIPNDNLNYTVQYRGSRAEGYAYRDYWGASDVNEQLRCQVLTDLSIYRPGGKLQFSLIAYKEKEGKLSLVPDRPLKVSLVDANGEPVDTLELTTDRQSRATGEFMIPEKGLLGSWNITVKSGEKWIASESVEVAEYKAPTFRAILDTASESFSAGEDLIFNGNASTYSGMPVSGAKVTYNVRFRPVWWRSAGANATYGGETITDDKGNFSISLPTENLEGTEFGRGHFILTASVTDKAGETVQTLPLGFSLGKALQITESLPRKADVSNNKLKGRVAVNDMAGHPVQKKIYYEISSCGDGEILKRGEFMSPDMDVDVREIPSGTYEMVLSLDPELKSTDDCQNVTVSLTLWRESDKVPAEMTPLWLPVGTVTAPSDASKIRVKVGSSYPDSWILAQFCTDTTAGEARWLRVSNGILEVEVDVPGMWNRAYVKFAGTRSLNTVIHNVTVIPASQAEKLRIEAKTFRDRIDPGSEESWEFRFSIGDKSAAQLPVMSVMSNKALNALAPFSWNFNPFGSLYFRPSMQIEKRDLYDTYVNVSRIDHDRGYTDKNFEYPVWNTYGYDLYMGSRIMYPMMRTAKQGAFNAAISRDSISYNSMAVAADAECETEDMSADMTVLTSEAAPTMGETEAIEPKDVLPEFRDIDCPLAFFMPSLQTDAEGMATLSFKTPAFVGTWQLQLLGYDDNLKGSVLVLDAVSAKSVMVQLNAPRFMRTGDKVAVSATLFNNSDEKQSVSGNIQLLDASTGLPVADAGFPAEPVQPSGSRVVTASFDVPSNVEALILRAYAMTPNHSDGEQTLVPVLPSSTPVTESSTFYLQQGDREYSFKLPELHEGAEVTFTYCDNPIWECVTALPALMSDASASVLSQAWMLYGNALACSLFDRYPQLLTAIKQMAESENAADKALESPLLKNEQIKNFMLNCTPWVNNANSETLRMQKLLEYADTEKCADAISTAVKTLTERQNRDGGWGWCPDMESSTFITGYVLMWLSQLADMECLPDGILEPAKKAFRYLDNALAKEWNESKRRYIPIDFMVNYLCDKAAFKTVESTAAFKPLESAAIKKIEADWRNLGISNKATAAILFERKSKPKLARTILESLRQYASESREKGMWFENMSHSFLDDVPLLMTARVLQAFALIEPSSPSVDLLRQWLVVQKQVQDWGDSRCTAEVIYALLSSGSDWTVPSRSPRATLNGKPLDLGRTALFTGSVTKDLPAGEASGATLRVERDGAGPAWGGIVSRYVAPILDVKAAKIPELSVEKNIYAIEETSSGRKASKGDFKVGDRVRVTLTLTCDRDLDYVAVGDSRAACLEPVDQISGYTSSDGVWFYREVRNESTNIFIPYLSKGTHVISYECTVDREGEYSLGIASAQSQYAPAVAAHSAGAIVKVGPSR